MATDLFAWHAAFCDHCRIMKGQSPVTIKGYRYALKSYVQYTGARSILDLSLHSIERWIAEGTAQRGWGPVTSRGRIRYMDLFAKWLVARGHLPQNPLKGVCFPKVPKGIPKSLPLDAADNLLRYARNMRFRTRFEGARAYALLATLIFTGIRKTELLNLELCDVDLERRVLAVRRGKGGKDRLLPILPQLNEALRPYLEIRNTSTRSKSPYFFIGRDSDGKIPDVVLRRAINRIRVKSGIYFAPHMMRHTFATLMLQGGCDVFSLSKLMGHSDIKTTTIYLSATIEHLREQAMKFPLLAGGLLEGRVAIGPS